MTFLSSFLADHIVYIYICTEFIHHKTSGYHKATGALCTSSTAQGSGGSFTIGNLKERLVVVNHGWQSEPPDGPTGLSICQSIYLAI